MNDSKTEMKFFGYPRDKPPVSAEFHQPAGRIINLDATLDVHPTKEAHIKRVFQVSYFQMKTIRTVQTAFVT